jgi:hypothetical protein
MLSFAGAGPAVSTLSLSTGATTSISMQPNSTLLFGDATPLVVRTPAGVSAVTGGGGNSTLGLLGANFTEAFASFSARVIGGDHDQCARRLSDCV